MQVAGELVALVGQGQPGDLVPGLASCALRWITRPTPHAARAEMKIWKAMLPSTVQPLRCQGTMSEIAMKARDHGPAHAGGQHEYRHHGQVDQQDAGERAEHGVRRVPPARSRRPARPRRSGGISGGSGSPADNGPRRTQARTRPRKRSGRPAQVAAGQVRVRPELPDRLGQVDQPDGRENPAHPAPPAARGHEPGGTGARAPPRDSASGLVPTAARPAAACGRASRGAGLVLRSWRWPAGPGPRGGARAGYRQPELGEPHTPSLLDDRAEGHSPGPAPGSGT